MSNASPVSICSNALRRLGASAIASFEEDTTFAGVCASTWPTVRNALLRAHNWNCATQRVLLPPLAQVPAFDFAYQFNLPTDWLRTLQVGKRGCPLRYQQEGRRLLADVNVLPLVYIAVNDNPGTWDDAMVEVAELMMAAAIAYTVTASSSLRDSFNQEAQYKLRVAKAVDGQDQPPEEFPESALMRARF